MKRLLLNILDRAKEPSSWAGLSGVAVAIGMSDPAYTAITAAIAGVSGLVAFILKESGAA